MRFRIALLTLAALPASGCQGVRRATASMEKPAMPFSRSTASAASRMASSLAGLRRAPMERRVASSVSGVFSASLVMPSI